MASSENRDFDRREPDKRRLLLPIAVTVVGLAAIGVAEDIPVRHSVEHKLTDSSEAALKKADVSYDSVSFTGRDGTVTVDSPDAGARAEAIVDAVTGVRVVTVVVLGASGPTSAPVTASPTPGVTITIEPTLTGPGLTGSTGSPSLAPTPPPSTPDGASASPGQPTATPTSPVPSPSPSPTGSAGGGTKSASEIQQQLDELGDITFNPGSAKLTSRDNAIVAKVAAILHANPDVNIRVQGDTDSVGPAAFNLTMSRNRANAVAKALVGLGLSSDRLTIIGYGETHPKVPNTTPQNRMMNRRVDIMVS